MAAGLITTRIRPQTTKFMLNFGQRLRATLPITYSSISRQALISTEIRPRWHLNRWPPSLHPGSLGPLFSSRKSHPKLISTGIGRQIGKPRCSRRGPRCQRPRTCTSQTPYPRPMPTGIWPQRVRAQATTKAHAVFGPPPLPHRVSQGGAPDVKSHASASQAPYPRPIPAGIWPRRVRAQTTTKAHAVLDPPPRGRIPGWGVGPHPTPGTDPWVGGRGGTLSHLTSHACDPLTGVGGLWPST